jgi:hypothetical protein
MSLLDNLISKLPEAEQVKARAEIAAEKEKMAAEAQAIRSAPKRKKVIKPIRSSTPTTLHPDLTYFLNRKNNS